MKTISIILLLVSGGLLLTACEDATNVGERLVGAQGGHPVTEEIPIAGVRPVDLERPSNLPPRVIAGAVEDPALGTYTVHGYLDVTPVTSSGFRAQPVQHAELRLSPSYVYGDTTGDVTLALREITEEWNPDGLSTDTSFGVGPIIGEFTVLSTDTLVVVPLPADWVDENDDVLRSADFGERFHGFRLDPVSGNAVVGFGPGRSSLFAVSSEDSSSSPVGRSYSSVERAVPVEIPSDRILMQAGSGPALSFSLVDDAPELPPSSVNRAAIVLSADTVTLSGNTPANFARPLLETLDVYGIPGDAPAVLLARATINDEGRYVFDSQSLARTVQDALLGRDAYDRFEVRIPNPTTFGAEQGEELYYYSSLNPVIFFSEGDKAPTGYLTRTPLD